MKTLEQYASNLISNEPFSLVITHEMNESILDTLNGTTANDERIGRTRTQKQREFAARKRLIEFALAAKLGMKMNDKPFDHSDPHTFAYDVYDPETNQTFECKSSDNNWYSFEPEHHNTLVKYNDLVDFVVVASVKENEGFCDVTFNLIADAKTFADQAYINKTKYETSKSLYYNHSKAYWDKKVVLHPNIEQSVLDYKRKRA